MKGLRTPGVIFIIAVSVLILCSAVWAAGTPKAVFPQTSFSFGEIRQGHPLIHTFRVINEGDAPLNISRVRPG